MQVRGLMYFRLSDILTASNNLECYSKIDRAINTYRASSHSSLIMSSNYVHADLLTLSR